MERLRFDDLPQLDRELIQKARDAADSAYAPYSCFAVGAAVRTSNENFVTASNLENASYGLTVCAEAAALAAANRNGDFTHLEAIAVVGFLFHPELDLTHVVTPCGKCRQLISEGAQVSDRDVTVFACSGNLEIVERWRISELLPQPFKLPVATSLTPASPLAAKVARGQKLIAPKEPLRAAGARTR